MISTPTMSDNLTFIDQPEAQRVCERWQKILRIEDWRIKVLICRDRDMTTSDCLGNCSVFGPHHAAEIKLCDPLDNVAHWAHLPDFELVLVHELLHVQFYYAEIPGTSLPLTQSDMLEWAVIHTSNALLTLDRKARGVADLTYYRTEPNE